ncbi:hypothetical protein P170DRAFT_280047 [Aspergillus steynii IBT 23096]|uniref:Uncharacterized protein n=1 Tax=Aspergillus steynii IBT 23096 TaxID=1392250 RepID=A0A2I2FXH5_9EURO|nr:uncharacterized protein P170DRAFT_280047 [Aspergillus steynii IBT 23096]PLB45338.1 hypothetical protein P170DRAFT_280047 [Aspergillus steynii IBT 23096]
MAECGRTCRPQARRGDGPIRRPGRAMVPWKELHNPCSIRLPPVALPRSLRMYAANPPSFTLFINPPWDSNSLCPALFPPFPSFSIQIFQRGDWAETLQIHAQSSRSPKQATPLPVGSLDHTTNRATRAASKCKSPNGLASVVCWKVARAPLKYYPIRNNSELRPLADLSPDFPPAPAAGFSLG